MRQPVSQQRVQTGPDGSRFRHTPATEAKRRTRQTAEGDTLWDLRGLLGELGTLQRNRIRFQLPGESEHPEVRLLTEPSPLQRRVFELL